MTADTINIACTADDAYAPHTATMLRSLRASNPGEPIAVWLLYGRLAADDLQRLRQVASDNNLHLTALAVPDALSATFPNRKFHRSCWYRVFLPELTAPSVTKILYLDSDMLVLQRLRPLWEIDVSATCFAAVTNPLYPQMAHVLGRLGLAEPGAYLNSGVMLMNLERMRREGAVAQLREYARTHPDNPYPEQDALSVVYQGRWLALHPRWNAQTTFWDLPAQQLPFLRADAEEASADPAIVHFIGPYKPWHYMCTHPLRHLYFVHRQQTPWPSAPLEGRTFRAVLLRPFPIAVHFWWNRVDQRLRDTLRPARVLMRKLVGSGSRSRETP